MTRIVHIFTVPLSLGFLRGQARELRRHGYDVTVITSPGEALEAFGRDEECRVVAIEMARRIAPISDLRALAQLVGALRELRPEIVHAHTPKGGLLGMIAAKIAGTPVRIYHMRGLPFVTQRGWRRATLRLTERLSASLSSRVIAVSASLRRVAVDSQICAPDKIVVLLGGSGQGVDARGTFNPSRYPPKARASLRASVDIPQDARVVGFVGRLVRDKGVVELYDAWCKLRETYDDAHLVLVGAPEPRDPVPQEVLDALARDPRVRMAGHMDEPAPWYALMDVVALPTYREGFPNVPLEAAAMGLPVVATVVPGCVDAVVDGVTGTLVAPGASDALATAIEAYLTDPSLAASHGAAGRDRALRLFQRESIWSAIRDTYDELLAPRGRASDGGKPGTFAPATSSAHP